VATGHLGEITLAAANAAAIGDFLAR